jgi:hypothetical protein
MCVFLYVCINVPVYKYINIYIYIYIYVYNFTDVDKIFSKMTHGVGSCYFVCIKRLSHTEIDHRQALSQSSTKKTYNTYWDSHNYCPRSARVIYSSARVIYSSARVNNCGNLSKHAHAHMHAPVVSILHQKQEIAEVRSWSTACSWAHCACTRADFP